MTKIEALEKTKTRFTNLIDGKVLNGVSVSKIISYYESLINKGKAEVSIMGNIERCFHEADISHLENEQYEELGL